MTQKISYSADELRELISKDKVTVLDVRDFYAYHQGHIPGAVSIPDVFYYLSESTPEGLLKMHLKFKTLFEKAGVNLNKKVIFYEHALNTRFGGSCRGYWLLSYLGHPDVGVLDGGLETWIESGYDMQDGDTAAGPGNFQLNIQNDMIATKLDVLEAINSDKVKLLDDRDRVEWIGESSSPYGVDFAPRKGRIPCSIWIEWYEFLDMSKTIPTFKSPGKIKELSNKHNIKKSDDIIIYCFKGSRASNTYIALKEAGFKNVRVYFASWNEWARDPNLPIDQGPV